MQHTTDSINEREAGFTAIVITTIIVGILTLLTIGFVQISLREQRSVIDRQLSTQAFYAAETGVSDAVNRLEELLANTDDPEGALQKTDCDLDGWNNELDEDGQVSYTCVLYDLAPPTLEYDSIKTDLARAIYLKGVDGDNQVTAIGSLSIRWQEEPAPDFDDLRYPVGRDFPVEFDSSAPVMRVSLTPLSSLSRADLVQNTMTFFLRPSSDTGSLDDASGFNADPQAQGTIIPVRCAIDEAETVGRQKVCQHQISNLTDASGYLATFRAYYSEASLMLAGGDTAPVELRFVNEQALIDSTGRANDVLRRIQVRIPYREATERSNFALQARAICKPYIIGPGIGIVDGAEQDDGICEY